MAAIWTHGIWTVKPGREEEFAAAWREMARDALTECTPRAEPHLLRERERPNVFRSFGEWDDAETVARFREYIRPHIERIGELTESIEFVALDEVGLDG